MNTCFPTFKPGTVWYPMNLKGNVGHWVPWELRNRCRGTSQYDPFWRAIRSLKTDGCGNGRGIKVYQSTKLGGMNTSHVTGYCKGNPYFRRIALCPGASPINCSQEKK